MNAQSDEPGRQHTYAGPGSADTAPADDGLSRALNTLLMFNDLENPLSLRQTITQVRRTAEYFRLWKESGALIRDVVLRLSDGTEINVPTVKNVDTNLFSFCFAGVLPPDGVLNIYKKADDEFGEVLLLSVNLGKVRSSGFSFSKAYPNQQSLAVKIDWQGRNKFCVSVDLAHPLGYLNEPVPPKPWHKLPVVGACVVALLALGVWWKRGWTKEVMGKIAAAIGYTVIFIMAVSALGSIKGRFDIPVARADSSPNWFSFVGVSQSSGVTQQVGAAEAGAPAPVNYAASQRTSRIPLYVTAWSRDPIKNKAVVDGLTKNLRSNERVYVLTDADGHMSKDAFKANLWYTDRYLLIELNDQEGVFGKLVEYFNSPPDPAQLDAAYRRLASRIVTEIGNPGSSMARRGKG